MPDRRDLAAAVALLAVVLALTNEWPSWTGGVELVTARDVASYEAVAEAVPSLPDADLPAQHAPRFSVHWLIGTVADGTGIDLHALYRAAWALLALAIVYAVHEALSQLRLGREAYWLCMGALLASPYLFRFYGIVPGLLADPVLAAGIAFALLGVLRRSPVLACAALAFAALGRETAILPAVLVGAYLALGPVFRDARRRWVAAAAAIGVPAAIYAVTHAVADGFSQPSRYGFSDLYGVPGPDSLLELTVLDSFAELGDSASEPAEHVLRVLLPHAVALLLLAGALAALWRRHGRRPSLPPDLWLVLGVWAAVVAPPLLLNPDVVARNEGRLSVLALPAAVIALGIVLRRVEEGGSVRLSRALWCLAGALFLAASLHHVYTRFGPASDAQFAAVELAAAAALGAVAYRAGRTGSTVT